MSKFCANCGQEVPVGTNYCTKCGASLNNDQTNTNNGSTVIINNYNNNSNLKLPNRNIALAVIWDIYSKNKKTTKVILVENEKEKEWNEEKSSGSIA